MNSGQSCNAPTRMLVPAVAHGRSRRAIARAAAEAKVKVGPTRTATDVDDRPGGLRASSSRRFRASSRRASRKGAEARNRRNRDRPDGPQPGLLRQADSVLPRHQRHDDRPGRDLRSRSCRHHRLRGPTRTPMRIANDTVYGLSELHLSPATRSGPGRIALAHPHRQRAPERRPRRTSRRPVRRLQAVRQRPGVGRLRLRGVPRGQGGHGSVAEGELNRPSSQRAESAGRVERPPDAAQEFAAGAAAEDRPVRGV